MKGDGWASEAYTEPVVVLARWDTPNTCCISDKKDDAGNTGNEAADQLAKQAVSASEDG